MDVLETTRTPSSIQPNAETCTSEGCPLCSSARGEAPHRLDDGLFWRADGTALPVSYASTPIAAGTETAGSVCVFSDATERKRAEAERDELLRRVQTLALTDELTGLANRRARTRRSTTQSDWAEI